jgi:hypothetical protein
MECDAIAALHVTAFLFSDIPEFFIIRAASGAHITQAEIPARCGDRVLEYVSCTHLDFEQIGRYDIESSAVFLI